MKLQVMLAAILFGCLSATASDNWKVMDIELAHYCTVCNPVVENLNDQLITFASVQELQNHVKQQHPNFNDKRRIQEPKRSK